MLPLTGCLGPELMVVSYVAQATVLTAMDEAEKRRPTPDQAWANERLALLERKAAAGDVESQYLVGQIHSALERRSAEHWMCEAANAGNAKAQMQMGHWYNEDRREEDIWPFIGASPDNTKAYVWYALAARNGEPVAASYRDALVRQGMTETEVARATASTERWRPGSCAYARASDGPAAPFDATEAR